MTVIPSPAEGEESPADERSSRIGGGSLAALGMTMASRFDLAQQFPDRVDQLFAVHGDLSRTRGQPFFAVAPRFRFLAAHGHVFPRHDALLLFVRAVKDGDRD